MFILKIETMTCNHCVSLISKALNQLDADLAFDIDLPAQTLQVHSEIDVSDVIAALEEAGYPAQLQ
jgi:copper chaperone